MANGIYLGINSREEQAEMDENRRKFHQIKVWFEKTFLVEIISIIYLSITSVINIFSLIFGVIYLFLLKRKNEKICKAATLAHFLLGLITVVTAVSFCVTSFAADTPNVSLISEALAKRITSMSTENLANSEGNIIIMDSIMDGVRIFSVINALLSLILSGLPVYFNYKAAIYCSINDELKLKPGYPYFHPDIALQRTAEEIANQKEHKIETDTASAVSNANLMNKLRDQNVDFSDTDALFNSIVANTKNDTPSNKSKGSQALNYADSLLRSASNTGKRQYASSDMNMIKDYAHNTADKLSNILGIRKETPNSIAMKALVEEAEKLRMKKQFQANHPEIQNEATPYERPISTWDNSTDSDGELAKSIGLANLDEN